MTAPNLPLTALPMAVEMLDGTEPIIQKLLQGTTVSPLFISNVFNQARLAHNLAAQVAQARREVLAEVADTLIATAQVYREQGDAKTARVLEIVAQLYPDALATPEAPHA